MEKFLNGNPCFLYISAARVRESRGYVSKMTLFDTPFDTSYFSEEEGYRLVSKLVSKSKFQNLTYVMSFDTIKI
jgi:hypothetical protein